MELTTSKPAPSKACLIHHFIEGDVTQGWARLKRWLSRSHLQYVARETYQVPDSHSCTLALEMVSVCSPDFLTNHCLRSYAFAVAMAHKINKPFDKEVLFLGSVMHDLGLTDQYDKGQTFELDGAKAAHDFCLGHGVEQKKAELVHEMVALHNSVGVAHKREPEIALLHYGAGADVAGLWIEDIHQKTLNDIIEKYPREGFKQGMVDLLSAQMIKKPASYMSNMVALGFLNKIRQSPF